MAKIFGDIETAYKEMRDNPVAFTDDMNSEIGKNERGAHRVKQQAIALGVGIIREVCADFEQFEELRSAECLQKNKRVQEATAANFQKVASIAAATRIFHNTDATKNRVRVYGYVMNYFVRKNIPVPRIPAKIKGMNGIEGVYKRVKAKKDEKASLRNSSKPAEVGSSNDRSSKSAKLPTVEAILKSYLLIKMSPEELDEYREDPINDGERRGLEIVNRGLEPNGLQAWEYVSDLEVEAPFASDEDNDNDAEGEDEDAA
ncbi:hypothetical protein [Methylobacterium oxalidis]|uniref:Uncharacterized protein n=1 Tax=Methylobacterium oxalidis TaxID=944322 RepID=A0A512J1L8_9HYPH|nr:hypothetical protein [Methylobacterium oxalidis]GEP03858.1 hypothetical protein MOX02_18960 [Methylobacterium oxalidis]GJE31267.1 hypothetical protein LDDCCGHA_1444 [Methylobacterium oxalidis]GLS65284.1 hypothetical protein GCM10007888_36660 [Methylobacterium oxalidis]